MGDFVMDDWPVFKENSKITDIKHIPDYFTSGVWANTDLSEQTGVGGHTLYRPLFLLTINIGHQLWGDSALGYHALNLVLHGINTILVYFLIVGFWSSASRMTAGMAAAIFAVHPVHVESVAWIAGITDPLVSLFLLSGFLLHRRMKLLQRESPHAGRLLMIGAPLCYALALLSKETAILFPLLLLIFDALFYRTSLKTPKVIVQYVAYTVLLILYFMLRSNALEVGELTADTLNNSGLWSRMDFQNWPVLLAFSAHYVQLLFFPSPLEYYYAIPDTGIMALTFGGLMILSAILYLPKALNNGGGKLYALSLAWVILFLLPALPIALFSEPVFATRVLYLPSVGFSLFLAWLIHYSHGRSTTLAMTSKVATSILLIWFAMATMIETEDWQNDTAFYSQAMKTTPDSYKPVAGLAMAKEREKNTDYAIDLYLRAAELAPLESEQLDFQENAASLYGQTGSTDKSEKIYQDILQRKPNRSSAWVGLGNNALARGNSQQALSHYQKAYQADPQNFVASYNLTMIYQSLGKLQMSARFRDISRRLQQAQQARPQ
ncbi:MAG: hypothetical protein COB30_013480 [Ectothiorhodospiraceae bacterium]|nr:hypothetical protein [Ectothiorhodospiraceae bacterium]